MQKLKLISNSTYIKDFWSETLVWLRKDFLKVNNVILENLSNSVPLISQLSNYIFSAGGKRIRPLLTLASAKLCGYVGERHINLAAAIEFIHTATLLHDDVIDDSKFRRGRKSANTVWGNKSSILVGDYLLSKAFKLMIKDGSHECLEVLSDSSVKIAQGEILQLETEKNLNTTETNYMDVIEAKTGSLFSAASLVGAKISDVNESFENALKDYGKFIGLAFQIIDDTLDYSSKDSQLGKNVGDDFRESKVSLPIILGYKRSNKKEKKFWERVIIEGSKNNADFRMAKEILNNYNVITDCFSKAGNFALMAKDSIGIFDNSKEKQRLVNLADVVAFRKN
tara:strand:- start:987 stop:2003 length:1017 start_codon:yes stop_codon:yes gene_type:complete